MKQYSSPNAGNFPLETKTSMMIQLYLSDETRTNVGANLVFALRQKTGNAPMSETNVFNYDNRFDLGFCSRANTRYAPTFVLGRNYILGY